MKLGIRCMLMLVIVAATLFTGEVHSVSADGPPSSNPFLRSGEFVTARQIAIRELPSQRDALLAQLAAAQSGIGQSVSAASTLRQIESPNERETAMAGARGGNSFADFQSLIDLIQTTVVPDTWEALGGPSTMSEYPQGIYVDSQGTVHECEASINVSQAENLRAILSREANRAGMTDLTVGSPRWQRPSELRFVSLQRLRDQIASHRMQGIKLPMEMRYLAGLSNVTYLMISEDDVVLAGPVGGLEIAEGWHRDITTKQHPLRADFLCTCLASAMSGQAFGCTIDPTTQGLQQAAQLAMEIKQNRVPIGQAADRMKEALGVQRVEVFGTAGDTPLGYLMVEADRHMKQLALGIQPMPKPAKNYLDMVDAMIAQGAPDDLLLRLWFTTAACDVRCDQSQTIFELTGMPIRLSGQNERALASGQRGNHTVDVRTQAFVEDFNLHWNSIRQMYPVYGSLESIYRGASVAELLRRYAPAELKNGLLTSLAWEASLSDHVLPAPRQVESISTMHTVRHGRTKHHILLASGGVAVDSKQTVRMEIETYPSLNSVNASKKDEPELIQRWWWEMGGER